MKEILREREANSFDAKSTPEDGSVPGPLVDQSHTLSPSSSSSPLVSSPSLQRHTGTGTDSMTPSLTADEDEPDKPPSPNHQGSPAGKDGGAPCQFNGRLSGASVARPPLCSLSVFRASDMLAFEDYLHRSRRLPTRLGFPELLPSPEKWHDWSWGQLRAPVYVVGKRPEGMQGASGTSPPSSREKSVGDVGDTSLCPDVHSLPDPLDILS